MPPAHAHSSLASQPRLSPSALCHAAGWLDDVRLGRGRGRGREQGAGRLRITLVGVGGETSCGRAGLVAGLPVPKAACPFARMRLVGRPAQQNPHHDHGDAGGCSRRNIIRVTCARVVSWRKRSRRNEREGASERVHRNFRRNADQAWMFLVEDTDTLDGSGSVSSSSSSSTLAFASPCSTQQGQTRRPLSRFPVASPASPILTTTKSMLISCVYTGVTMRCTTVFSCVAHPKSARLDGGHTDGIARRSVKETAHVCPDAIV